MEQSSTLSKHSAGYWRISLFSLSTFLFIEVLEKIIFSDALQ